MSCLSVDIRRVRGLSAGVSGKNTLSVSYSLSKKPVVKLKLLVSSVSDFEAEVKNVDLNFCAKACSCNVPVFVKVSNWCGQIIPSVYLEIEPEIIWVYSNMEVDNNVYSNTKWHIN